MIQLQILSGKMAGTSWTARRFPVRIGRAQGNDLRLEEDGVWDEHLRLDFQRREGFTLSACSDALATVNDAPLRTARLRNGDSVEFGSVRLRFWLADARQSSTRLRDGLVWALIALVSLGQIALVYWLLN